MCSRIGFNSERCAAAKVGIETMTLCSKTDSGSSGSAASQERSREAVLNSSKVIRGKQMRDKSIQRVGKIEVLLKTL
jgi:hypothetical protein